MPESSHESPSSNAAEARPSMSDHVPSSREPAQVLGQSDQGSGQPEQVSAPQDVVERPTPRRPRTLTSGIALGSSLIIVAAMIVLRSIASTIDFAMVNAITFGLGFLAWLVLIVGLWASRLPRAFWRLALALPVVLCCLLFAFYKVERLDGDLIPQFAWRWQSHGNLPDVLGNSAPADESLFASRPTDFPQYLGPHRDAMLPSIELATDWQAQPPSVAWKQPIGDGWSGFAVQGDVAITMEQRGNEEWVTAYHVSDGTLLWNYSIAALHTNPLGGTGPRSTPTIDDGRVYACSAVNRIVCLDLTSGKGIWTRDLLDLSQQDFETWVAWGRSASPLVIDGQIIIPQGGEPGNRDTLIALDAQDGTQIWSAGDDQISYSSPLLATIASTPQILYTSEKMLAAYDPSDGRLLWSTEAPSNSNGDANTSQPVVLDDGRILITKGYGQGARLIEVMRNDAQWSVKELWKTPQVLRTKFTSCVVLDGFAYGLSDGILECVDLSNGQRVWKRGRYRQGQVLLAGKHLLVTSEEGEVVLLAASPESFQELGRIQVIGDVSWNTAALSGQRLLVRNSDEAACVLLPLAEDEDAAQTVAAPIRVSATSN